jgi:hypothetical protein
MNPGLVIAIGALLLYQGSGPVQAQILDRYLPPLVQGQDELNSDTVLSRPRPEYDSLGLRFGDILVNAGADESVGYDSNVFATSHGPGSARIETNATLAANSDWSRDALGVYFNVDNVQTPNTPELSSTNSTASVSGALDVGRGQLRGSYSFLNLNVLPTDIEGTGLTQAVPFQLNDLRISYKVPAARFTFIPELQLQTFRFSDIQAGGSFNGQAFSDLKYLDRDIETGGITSSFELAPQRDLLLVMRVNDAQYISPSPVVPRHNYIDGQILAGFDYTANAVFRYRALAGFEVRDYDGGQTANTTAPIVEASVVWNPNRLTTVTGTLTRRIEDALEDNIADYTYSEARLQVDREVRRDVLVQAYGDVQRVSYQQNGGTQTEYGTGLSATWLINRRLRSQLSFGFVDSTGPPLTTYTRETGLLHLTVGF